VPHEVSRSGSQTWSIALNLEHWDTISWKNLITLLSLMFWKLEKKKKGLRSLGKQGSV
jgi:hypothetical protein